MICLMCLSSAFDPAAWSAEEEQSAQRKLVTGCHIFWIPIFGECKEI